MTLVYMCSLSGDEHADVRQDGWECFFLFLCVFTSVCTLYPLLQAFKEESWKHQLRR